MKVEGKVILITGAGSGLGLETVYRLVSAGANVIAVDRNIDNLKKSSQLHPYQLDVTDWQAMTQMYHDILSKYGKIDVVCNNAGLFEPKGGHFWADEDRASYPTIDVNLTALMKSTRLAISAFLKQPKPKDGGPLGVIVNTTSVAACFPCFAAPVYAASKWGVLGFTRSMDYLHPTMNIRCCGLAPGAFHTPLWSEEKRSWMDNAEWLPLTQVVDGLIRCIEDENIKGGDILEVLTDKTRIMPLGGPLPSGPGAGPVVEGGEKAAERVIKFLQGEDVKF